MSEVHLTQEELEAQIEAQRNELAATVDQLAHKLDVKAQVRSRVQRITPAHIAAAVGAFVVVGGLVWWRKTR